MVYAANDCPNLRVIEGVENVVEAIGRVSLQITSLIDEHTRLPFASKSNTLLILRLLNPGLIVIL